MIPNGRDWVESRHAVCQSKGMRVLETFEIERGLVVALDAPTGLPVGKRLNASVTREDGTSISAVAFKEWLLRRDPHPTESEAILLQGLKKADVPIGSDVAIELSSPVAGARHRL